MQACMSNHAEVYNSIGLGCTKFFSGLQECACMSKMLEHRYSDVRACLDQVQLSRDYLFSLDSTLSK
jgi:hypothetical protein